LAANSVPEPSTLTLLALGVVGLLFVRRRLGAAATMTTFNESSDSCRERSIEDDS
jgi:hypothetical protein